MTDQATSLFLINAGSGRKRNGQSTAEMIQQVYKQASRSVETQFIDFEKLDETLESAINRGIHNVFAVGGDGTVNAIGTRLIGRSLNLGVIPNGSGNGYARNLGYSVKTRLAVRQSLDALSIKVDTGLFNDIPFLNVAGVGLDAEVAYNFSQGKHRGFGPYVKSSAESLIGFKPEQYRLIIDGKELESQQLAGIIIANGSQWGYDAKITSQASLTDGLFDIMAVRKFPLVKAGLMVGRMFSGRLSSSNYVDAFQARSLEIYRTQPGYAQVDGEPFETGAVIKVEIQTASLNVLLPNTLTDRKIQSL